MSKPVNGPSLCELFSQLNPFDSYLSLKSYEDRKTVLAANANFAFEMPVSAFCKAVSADGGSPVIIQFSGNALGLAGRGLAGKDISQNDALRLGAGLAKEISAVYCKLYNTPFVALGLDHYAVPEVNEVIKDAPGVSCGKEKQILAEAIDAAASYGISSPTGQEIDAWERYLASPQYKCAVEGFMIVLEEMNPAWAMIDTEKTPPVLNYAVTKQVCDMVGQAGYDCVLEAEYGETGQAGKTVYEKTTGEALTRLAREIAGFVKYTGARGISYPIGMEHAAAKNEKHEPDTLRLETVQREIIKETGVYVPFAQHGGTGASQVARGLVGKNNINTRFLVAAAQHLSEHCHDNKEAIDLGKKAACGSGIYVGATKAIMEAAVDKLKECGSYGYFGSK